MKKCKHFRIYELVSKPVFEKYGERAWTFFDPRLLITIDWFREKIGKPVTINNWYWGGSFSQRGLRCNIDPLVKSKTDRGIIYCSPHPFGQAVDFDVEGMTAQEVRQWFIDHQDELPFPIRLEGKVNWVHMDVRDSGVKVYVFNP